MSGGAIGAHDAASLMLTRRVRNLATVDQVRLVAAAVLVFLLLDVVRLAVVAPVPLPDQSLITTMDVVGYLAIIVALWRPGLGLTLAVAPLGTALFWTSSSLDAVLLAAVPALAIAQLSRRPALLASAGAVGYVALRAGLYTGDQRAALLLTLGGAVTLGLLAGWAGHTVRERRERAARADLAQAVEDARIRADERRDLAADLHDVVVHHLSTASLHLLGVADETDPVVLRRVLGTVQASNTAALTELRLLARVLRSDPATAASGMELRELSRQVPPTQAVAEGQLALVRAGFEPQVQVPAAADSLELTVQRTLARLVAEAVANQRAHAPAGARCSIEIQLNDHQVGFQARNALAPGQAGTPPTLGWGLRGVRERVALTGGTLSAGPIGPEWVLTASLPHD